MKENPTIKHLVIAGGGTYGYQAYGFLQELREKEKIWFLVMQHRSVRL